MRILNAILLIIAVNICFAGSQSNPDIYISPTGNDQNAGTKSSPVRSVKKVQELLLTKVRTGKVQVIFADGIYYLPNPLVLTADFSGSEEKPVIFRAENEGKAIISGGKQIDLKWEPYKNGIFKATVAEEGAIDQLYVNGQRQRMARFPNAVDGKNVFDTWDLVHTNNPDTINDPLDKKRIAIWTNPEGAYIHAMHNALWGDMHWIVKGKNADGSLNMEGGWQNNRPSAMHPRYRMIENVFEELDMPGEWFYNKEEKTLYFYPQPGIDPKKAKIEIVRLRNLIELKGTKEKPVRFVRFEGFVFRHAARTFMDNKEPLLRSDWTTYRGGAVMFNNAEDCALVSCEFDQVGGNSIFVSNYNRRISIKNCYIHHSGANGIAFVGDPGTVRSPLFRYGNQDFAAIDRTPGPKGDNYPEDCRVEDCLITMTGRDEKQTAPVQISISYKITVSHCSIYDVPRAGINISEGTFGGHVIEYCDVFNTVLETGDHGSFNSWGRDRFWTPEITETDVEVQKQPNLPFLDMLEPNIIRNSRWRCDHGWDIDLDDGSSWYRIYNNLLLNGGLKMREGYDREATNNVIVNNSLHPHAWYPNSNDVFAHNIVFGAYKPAVMGRAIAQEGKWGTQLDSNLFATDQEDLAKFQMNGCDGSSLVGNPIFMDAENGDFRVKDGSPALQIGFKNFPMDEFGVTSEKLKKIARHPVIPTMIINQKDNAGQTYQWYGATLKNVETLGEQSAAGLPEISGVILLDVPLNSAAAKSGLKVGDVVLQCQEVKIQNFKQLLQVEKDFQYVSELKLFIQRNQTKQTVMFGKQ
jgi:hypothetical protein